MCQGSLEVSGPWARERSARLKSTFVTEVGTSSVKHVNEDRAKRSAVDYLNGVLIACPGEAIFGPLYPFPCLQFHGTPRPRGALATGAWA